LTERISISIISTMPARNARHDNKLRSGSVPPANHYFEASPSGPLFLPVFKLFLFSCLDSGAERTDPSIDTSPSSTVRPLVDFFKTTIVLEKLLVLSLGKSCLPDCPAVHRGVDSFSDSSPPALHLIGSLFLVSQGFFLLSHRYSLVFSVFFRDHSLSLEIH